MSHVSLKTKAIGVFISAVITVSALVSVPNKAEAASFVSAQQIKSILSNGGVGTLNMSADITQLNNSIKSINQGNFMNSDIPKLLQQIQKFYGATAQTKQQLASQFPGR